MITAITNPPPLSGRPTLSARLTLMFPWQQTTFTKWSGSLSDDITHTCWSQEGSFVPGHGVHPPPRQDIQQGVQQGVYLTPVLSQAYSDHLNFFYLESSARFTNKVKSIIMSLNLSSSQLPRIPLAEIVSKLILI